jgi:hypothetical protein
MLLTLPQTHTPRIILRLSHVPDQEQLRMTEPNYAVHRWSGHTWEEARVADLRRGDEVQLVSDDPDRPPLTLLVTENPGRTRGESAMFDDIEFASARTADGVAG